MREYFVFAPMFLITAVKNVFKDRVTWIIFPCVFWGVISLIVFLPNVAFVQWIMTTPLLALGRKASLLFGMYSSFQTNLTPYEQVTTSIIAVLFALNISMVVYYFKSRIAEYRGTGLGFAALIFGVLGIGCTSCGSVILSAVLGFAATAGILRILPFHGDEFALISIVLMVASSVILARKMSKPFVCAAVKR